MSVGYFVDVRGVRVYVVGFGVGVVLGTLWSDTFWLVLLELMLGYEGDAVCRRLDTLFACNKALVSDYFFGFVDL